MNSTYLKDNDTLLSHRINEPQASIIQYDESQVLEVYRRAKRLGYADIAITIQEGVRVKLWLTEKSK